MFSILDRGFDRNCQGSSRREFLRIGTLGAGVAGLSGLSLPQLLAAQAAAGESASAPRKSVVLLFLSGGPSQHEMWDPKPDAPKEYRSTVDTIPTALPGVRFSSYFPKMAALANDLAIVRSFASGNGGHTYDPVTTGGNASKASMSAVYALLGGSTNPANGLPSNMLVLPEAVDEKLKLGSNFETGALPTLTQTGMLGSRYEAFSPAGGSQLKQSMSLSISRERFDDRRLLLAEVDRMQRGMDADPAMAGTDRYRKQAFDILTKGIKEAFDLTKEDPATIERYDTSKLFKLEEATKWYDMKRASNLLGKQMLLARRLCEAGAGFVTVSDCGWDHHANNNSPKNMEGLKWLAPQVDHAVSAFVQDIKDRGLSDKIMLVVTGEMGRTPRLNKNGGRDHHGELTPLILAGGGVKVGQVVGQSDFNAQRPATKTYKPAQLFNTVMNYLFDLAELRLRTDIGRNLKEVFDNAGVIDEVV